MYEVGLALAIRPASDVLLIRDDRDDFLFDVSTIPHQTMDFTKEGEACSRLNQLLYQRLQEQELLKDARVTRVCGSLTASAAKLLMKVKQNGWRNHNLTMTGGVGGEQLHEESLLEFVGLSNGECTYRLTEFGSAVLARLPNEPPKPVTATVEMHAEPARNAPDDSETACSPPAASAPTP